MNAIIEKVNDWFVPKKEHFRRFASTDTRLEGWLKAELIVLLSRLLRRRAIEEFKREAKIGPPSGRKQVDFRIRVGGDEHFCELKALCISQAATRRGLRFYFRNDERGLVKDFRKLDAVSGNRWVLAFVYPKPEATEWDKVTRSLPDDVKHWHCTTSLRDFPDHVFISLWRPNERTGRRRRRAPSLTTTSTARG